MAPWMNGAKEGGFDIEGFELANFIIGALFARAGIPLLIYSFGAGCVIMAAA
jgi:hypothetical protein